MRQGRSTRSCPAYDEKTSDGDSRVDKSKTSRLRLGKVGGAHCYFWGYWVVLLCFEAQISQDGVGQEHYYTVRE